MQVAPGAVVERPEVDSMASNACQRSLLARSSKWQLSVTAATTAFAERLASAMSGCKEMCARERTPLRLRDAPYHDLPESSAKATALLCKRKDVKNSI